MNVATARQLRPGARVVWLGVPLLAGTVERTEGDSVVVRWADGAVDRLTVYGMVTVGLASDFTQRQLAEMGR